jgi:hypothetical protein
MFRVLAFECHIWHYARVLLDDSYYQLNQDEPKQEVHKVGKLVMTLLTAVQSH